MKRMLFENYLACVIYRQCSVCCLKTIWRVLYIDNVAYVVWKLYDVCYL